LTVSNAVAAVAAALNDAGRALIGDPRKRQYKVAVQFAQLKEAFEFARQLARIKIVPSTTIVHDEMFGAPVAAIVNVYGKDDQRRLLELLASRLDESPRTKLSDLVLARSPIPDGIVERMVQARERHWNFAKIADKMNEQGIIEGMGGVRWTPQKVKQALAQYNKKHRPWSGAVEPGV
jgi:hypothetical protein